MSKPVILTGLRTNAGYHLGNYLGAILPMVKLQKEHLGEYQINMFAPDLHSFTSDTDHKMLYNQTMDNLKVFVASGMPIYHPEFYIYRQSYIPAHSELTVILNNFAYFGELNRMIQFKDKKKQEFEKQLEYVDTHEVKRLFDKEYGEKFEVLKNIDPSKLTKSEFQVILAKLEHLKSLVTIREKQITEAGEASVATAGLFDYPVLMASDILLYGALFVPVGEDQRQHLELTRDLGIRMNNKFGELFTIPEDWKNQLKFLHKLEGTRIRSLRNPEKKMSKSIEDPSGTIQLSDTPDEATKKVKSAETDSIGVINWNWEAQPGITNLLQIYELLSGKSHDEVLAEWVGKERYGDLKSATAEQVAVFLDQFHANLAAIDEERLQQKLDESEAKMTVVANETLLRVQKAVGLRRA